MVSAFLNKYRLFLLTLVMFEAIALHAVSPVAGAIALVGSLTLPGYLFIRALKIERLGRAETAIFTLVMSAFILMLVGLVVDLVLPLFGMTAPLAYGPVAIALGVVVAIELVALYARKSLYGKAMTWRLPSFKQGLLATGLLLVPMLAAVGADLINNGGTSVVTIAALSSISVGSVALVAARNKVPKWAWGWSVFCFALAALLATSLRGLYITGHDVQFEYHVYQLTDAGKHWSMANLHDAYNACLSITILPTVLHSLTGFGAIFSYKVTYQVLFAAFTTGVFTLARRFAGNVVAFLAALVFITFPTFITDMPMLCRQEIALGFFIAFLLVLFQQSLSVKTRRLLFALFGVGMVVSHYSTTFVAIGLLVGAYLLVLPMRYWLLRSKNPHRHRAITLGAVVVLVGTTTLWTGAYTRTSGNITKTIVGAVREVPQLVTGKLMSQAPVYGVGNALSPQAEVDAYAKQQKQAYAAAVAEAGGGYANQSKFALTYAPEVDEPVTAVGRALSKLALAPHLLNSAVKGGYGLAMQGLLIVSAGIVLLLRRRFNLSIDYVVLAPAAVVLAAVQVVFPIINYGLLRMLQQDLVFLALPIVLVLLQLIKWLRIIPRRAAEVLVAGAFATAFLFLSGVVTQITGGGPAQLALSNSGVYYDLYYTNSSDIAAYSWLENNYAMGYPIYSDSFSRTKLLANTNITTLDGLTPGSISKQSYVFLSNSDVTADRVPVYYGTDLVAYTYPTAFLDEAKNLIYSNDDNRVYR